MEQGTKDKEEERRKRIFATEASHWYQHNGSPCHQILKQKKKKGDPDEYRGATIADARKMNLLPSVTNLIGKFSNKSGIEIWKRSILLDQLTPEIVAKLMGTEHGSDERDAVLKQIADAADKETGKYAELGTFVHACIERGIQKIIKGHEVGGILNMVNEMARDTGFEESAGRITDIILSLHAHCLITKGANVIQEKGFAFNVRLHDGIEFGLAGKVDLLVEYSAAQVEAGLVPSLPEFAEFRFLAKERAMKGLPTRMLLDFKTRKPNRLKNGSVTFPTYPSDIAQLAGYAEGAKYAAGFKPDMCCNVLISSDSIKDLNLPQVVDIRTYSPSKIEHGMAMLKAMAGMWVAEETMSQEDPYIPCLPQEI